MSLTNTNIQLKRSLNSLARLKDIDLDFAEPLFVDNTELGDDQGHIKTPCKAYLVMGRKQKDGETDSVTVEKSPVFKALSPDIADNLVFYNADDGSITNEAGDQIPVNRLTAISKTVSDLSSEDLRKYHLICQADDDNVVYKFTLDDLGIFINGRGIMQGAAWNDYAETRPIKGEAEPGQVVCDNEDGTVSLSKYKFQACGHIVSDTYGQLIGENKDDTIPIAVAGRVLVKIKDKDLAIGDCVCAGPDGFAEKMTRQEIISYPDRIIGTICEIPKSEYIGTIKVDDRVWVNVK